MPENRKHYHYLIREVRTCACKDTNKIINDICDETEANSQQNNSRALYFGVGKIAGTYAPKWSNQGQRREHSEARERSQQKAATVFLRLTR